LRYKNGIATVLLHASYGVVVLFILGKTEGENRISSLHGRGVP
jgi:hypothetical protein